LQAPLVVSIAAAIELTINAHGCHVLCWPLKIGLTLAKAAPRQPDNQQQQQQRWQQD
jgi:hypothetical protein